MGTIGWMVVVIAFFLAARAFIVWYGATERICMLLRCEKRQAKVIKAYIESSGIEWSQLHSWTMGAEGRFMPMFADASTTQLIAPWEETKRAVLALALKRKLRKSWSDEEAIAAIGAEILVQRGIESRLVGKSQKNVVDCLVF